MYISLKNQILGNLNKYIKQIIIKIKLIDIKLNLNIRKHENITLINLLYEHFFKNLDYIFI
jgi:hypothetical protein